MALIFTPKIGSAIQVKKIFTSISVLKVSVTSRNRNNSEGWERGQEVKTWFTSPHSHQGGSSSVCLPAWWPRGLPALVPIAPHLHQELHYLNTGNGAFPSDEPRPWPAHNGPVYAKIAPLPTHSVTLQQTGEIYGGFFIFYTHKFT